MDTTKFITGTLAGTVASMVAGFLVFGMALSGYMAENVAITEEMDWLWLILGHLMFAAALTYIFLKWAGIKTAVTGAKAAAIITLLVSLGANWIWFSMSGLFSGGIMATVVDALGATVVWAIGGAVIGMVLGRGE